MRVKVKVSFRNPKTNRLTEVGEVFNVPKNQFWLKRLNAKDIGKTKDALKESPVPKVKSKKEILADREDKKSKSTK